VPFGWGAAHAAAGAPPPAARAVQGHEDLRQDERVMQLFGLVNTMLAHDRTTAERDLSIARYAVIPLSPNSGAAPAGHRPAMHWRRPERARLHAANAPVPIEGDGIQILSGT